MGAGDRRFWNGVGLNRGEDKGMGSIEWKLREGPLSCLSICPESGPQKGLNNNVQSLIPFRA